MGLSEIKLSTPMKIFSALTTILILYCIAYFYIQGGLPYVPDMVSWNTLALPVILPIAVITLLQRQVRNLRTRRGLDRVNTASFFTAFLLTLGAGAILGLYDPYYLDVYDMIPNTAYAAMLAVVGYNFASAFIRAYVARSWVSGLILVFLILSILGASPLGEIYVPPTKVFGDWWSLYAQGGLQTGWSIATIAATTMMIIRIFIGKERLRSRM
jgi:cell shape-determining protein MreD